jgi:HPt (histidine-containing phosphotransfer) domain-containing protein
MTTADDDTRALLRTIWARRREDVLGRVALIEAALAAEPAPDERTEATRQAHMLAGSAGTFGFPHASDLARTIEHALESGAPVDDRMRATAAALREELEGEPPG